MEIALMWIAIAIGALMAQNSSSGAEPNDTAQSAPAEPDLEAVLSAYFAAKNKSSVNN